MLRFSRSSSALQPCPAQGPALGASQPRGRELGPPWAPSDRPGAAPWVTSDDSFQHGPLRPCSVGLPQ